MFYSGPASRAWLATEKFLGRRLMQVGLVEDELLNTVAFDGQADQTLSVHASDAALSGKRWACILCVALSRFVQADHCTLVRSPSFVMPEGAAIRAFLLITLALFLVAAIPVEIVRALISIL